ncbi:hypothetical protein OEZ86_001000 [Tetradesmus obliquus]|nr:hypothetical protein OEZ86_001000 [Tetradesmus obliquus]
MSKRDTTLRLLSLAALCLLAAAKNANTAYDEDAAPPDWAGGDLDSNPSVEPPSAGAAVPVQPDVLSHRTERMQVLDGEARIFLFRGFLSPEECDHIIALSDPQLQRSGVVNTESGGSDISDIRTSSGVFLERGQDDVVKAIEQRIAAWTLLPVGNGEGLQVLRYHKSQKYDAHWDYFFHKEGTANGGNRAATVLSYLSDVEEGGETVFPNIPAPGGENVGFSECARKHLAVRPRKGDAVLFHSIAPHGALEKKSLHAACPVIKGVKYSMAKWIHVGHYATAGEVPIAIEQEVHQIPKTKGACEDDNDFCDSWASTGECTNNVAYMIGSKYAPGHCLKACGMCHLLKEWKGEGEGQQQQQGQAEAEVTAA